jgi:hypothetical protein
MGTLVIYNNVQIHHCLTKRFEQETVYDDSGTDYLYTRFRVQVVGYVHANLQASVTANVGVRTDVASVDTSGAYAAMTKHPGDYVDGAAQNFNVVRTKLATPRQAFQMKVDVDEQGSGGTVLLSAEAVAAAKKKEIFVAGDTVAAKDVDNGPKPKLMAISHLVADNIFRVEWEVEVCKVECSVDGAASTANKTGILSNRWSMTDEIDNNFYTTRTIQGRLRVVTAHINPHSFRGWVVPPLNNYFRRERMSFTATADGLNLDYTIVDREVAYAAPPPATKWRFEITENMMLGRIAQTVIDLRMSCPRTTDKTVLYKVAAQIIENKGFKMQLGNAKDKATVIVREASFTDIYGDEENSIAAHAVLEHAGDGKLIQADQIFRAAASKLGRPLSGAEIAGYKFEESIDPKTLNKRDEQAGTTGIVGAFSAYLMTGCGSEFSYNSTGNQLAPTKETGPVGQKVAMTATILPPNVQLPDTSFTAGHLDFPYTRYVFQNAYRVKSNSIQLAIAGPAPSSSGSSGSSTVATSVIAQLAPKTAKRTVRIMAERVGKQPEIPSEKVFLGATTLLNAIPQDLIVIPRAAEMTADGKYLFRSDMEIEYAQERPNNLESEPVVVGVSPWINDPNERPSLVKTDPSAFTNSMFEE